MDSLNKLVLLFFLFSCAKVVYVAQQLPEQVFLIYGAEANNKILNDPKVPKKYRDKIVLIQEYKKYFYKYLKKNESDIYSKTMLLKRDAVSYLVIASKFDRIEAKKECFPFVGCFPYLGFFAKEDAIKYARKLELEDYHTWVRPVYAYSSLNYFNDPILSSFFSYNDFELAELIFHELFHTVFFVKDEVDLNENLANYFARKMAFEYFQLNEMEIEKIEKQASWQKELGRTITDLTRELQKVYKDKKDLTITSAKEVLASFIENRLLKVIGAKCELRKIDQQNCYPLHRKWNNASLAAFLTYEREADHLRIYHKRTGLNLKDFYTHLEKKYKDYRDKDIDINFRDYLLKK